MPTSSIADGPVAVVIPCYKVRKHVLGVIAAIPPIVEQIWVVDDACPEHTGDYVEAECTDPRVKVVRLAQNGGVGAAVMAGYRAALAAGAAIMVKIDGDGQMPPSRIPQFITPIQQGLADYTKGNRFFDPESLAEMPGMRLFGNLMLSFLTKLSSGYWHVVDPTNGYTAIDARLVARLRLDKIATRYFFESDLLFRLGTLRAVVLDVPMRAEYPHEDSSLSISRVIGPFLFGNLRNLAKRVMYMYYLRDFSLGSLLLPLGIVLTGFGFVFGSMKWAHLMALGTTASAGTVMLAALPLILGIQMLLTFIQFDVQNVPRNPVGPLLAALDDSAWREQNDA
ncbi:MAG: glycosyltransferase family 2 protein [Ramlibacter sp.]|nr:glycosyltransferase family 2 protein [Ramlibacter sp.]